MERGSVALLAKLPSICEKLKDIRNLTLRTDSVLILYLVMILDELEQRRK